MFPLLENDYIPLFSSVQIISCGERGSKIRVMEIICITIVTIPITVFQSAYFPFYFLYYTAAIPSEHVAGSIELVRGQAVEYLTL